MASGTTSIWGRPYPVSGDAPAVHSDIQALANSLETTPLFPTSAVSSRSGVAGESVAVSPSQTLTLPASPVKGDIVQIMALGTVTGATPATVATAGGKVVNGLGMSAVSSFVLGAPNAVVTVQYDGTAWRMTSGQQDTGWIQPTFSAGWGFDNPPYPFAGWRATGDKVWFNGFIQNTSGSSISIGNTIFNIPSPYRPLESFFPVIPSGSVAAIDVLTNGNVQNQNTVTAGQLVALQPFWYSIT